MDNIIDYKVDGFQNERNFAQELDGKRVRQLKPLYYHMIIQLYGKVCGLKKVHAWVDDTKKKYDIVIKIGKVEKKISIKKGINNSMHVEMKIGREHVMTYLKYHYADGTTNGKGEYRMSVQEYKLLHQEEINQLNTCLNHPFVLRQAINRFVLMGRNSEEKIDGIIYGVVNDFIFISAQDIIRVIESKKDISMTGVHFGPLCCQPMTRNLNYNPLYEKKRFCVQIKWYDIYEDIVDYMRKKEQSKYEQNKRI